MRLYEGKAEKDRAEDWRDKCASTKERQKRTERKTGEINSPLRRKDGAPLGGSGSERDVEAEFEFGALPDPCFGFGARTKRHCFPSNLFHEDFPDAREAIAQISWR